MQAVLSSHPYLDHWSLRELPILVSDSRGTTEWNSVWLYPCQCFLKELVLLYPCLAPLAAPCIEQKLARKFWTALASISNLKMCHCGPVFPLLWWIRQLFVDYVALLLASHLASSSSSVCWPSLESRSQWLLFVTCLLHASCRAAKLFRCLQTWARFTTGSVSSKARNLQMHECLGPACYRQSCFQLLTSWKRLSDVRCNSGTAY